MYASWPGHHIYKNKTKITLWKYKTYRPLYPICLFLLMQSLQVLLSQRFDLVLIKKKEERRIDLWTSFFFI